MALFRLKKDTEKDKTLKDVVVSDTKKAETSAGEVSADVLLSVGIPQNEKTKKEKVKETKEKLKKKTISSDISSLNYNKDIASVLRHPRVTEKATLLSERGVYVFDVLFRATKKDVAEAVKELYKVTPRKINMVKVPSKKMRIRGRQNKFGVKSGGKKAYVYVKKGDTINIV